MTAVEWFTMTLDGELRLFFLDKDGYVNLMEESARGDQVADATAEGGVSWEEIDSYGLSRAYSNSVDGLETPVELALALATLNPKYDLNVVYNSAFKSTALASDRTRSPVKYTRPWDKADWDSSNVNNDFASPDREDYGVWLLGPELIPATAQYALVTTPNGAYTSILYQFTGLIAGRTYRLVNDGSAVAIDNRDTYGPDIVDLTVTANVPLTFTAVGDTLLLQGTSAGLVNTSLKRVGLANPAGVTLQQYQEGLHTARISGRQGRSFQVEFNNTQGRCKLLAMRITSVPGRNRRGVQT
jgi:hypothetical protein